MVPVGKVTRGRAWTCVDACVVDEHVDVAGVGVAHDDSPRTAGVNARSSAGGEACVFSGHREGTAPVGDIDERDASPRA